MDIKIFITITICLLLILLGIFFTNKFIKTNKAKNLILLFSSLATILCHYSSLLYHWIGHLIYPNEITTAFNFLISNPNLILPIYPCNVVMWGLLLLALNKKKESITFKIEADFLFFFGIVAGLGGLFANGDYFNPNVALNYDIYKSSVAHGFMIFNILLLPTLKFIKLEPLKNTIRSAIGIIVMGLIGLYCSIIELVISGKDLVLSWNAMFLFRSPFDGFSIVRFHIIMPLFLCLLFIILVIVDVLNKKHKKMLSKSN